ncbi:hypothetical protein PsorP6_010910 [Peronosclerospora sorghi]|uniref:Uncharacterized protein n=1 Tax=Peronosclerospora sorghi TaxID=230839 RepID=A0ACC0VTD6_9STRA|nr:hypothetical protein PsorP6_010910 [Peronosclerospora sorghi]
MSQEFVPVDIQERLPYEGCSGYEQYRSCHVFYTRTRIENAARYTLSPLTDHNRCNCCSTRIREIAFSSRRI